MACEKVQMEDVPYFCQFSTSRLPQECPSPAPPELTPPPSSARLDTGDIPTVSTTVVRQHINAYQLSVGFRFSSLFFPWSPEQLPAAVEKWLGRQQWKNYHPSGPCKAGGGTDPEAQTAALQYFFSDQLYPCMRNPYYTRSSIDADKPARRVWRSVKVRKHSTIRYVTYGFLLVCYSKFVHKTRRF